MASVVNPLVGSKEEMLRLLNAGADPEEQTSGGWRLVHFLARDAKKAHMLEALLEYGAKPDPQKDDGWTPMMLAVFNENIKGAALLAGKADLDVENNAGDSCKSMVEEMVRWRHFGFEGFRDLMAQERARREKEVLSKEASRGLEAKGMRI